MECNFKQVSRLKSDILAETKAGLEQIRVEIAKVSSNPLSSKPAVKSVNKFVDKIMFHNKYPDQEALMTPFAEAFPASLTGYPPEQYYDMFQSQVRTDNIS